ncbi:MAG: maltooligosyltrehalose trehalohydrolase, partial [Microbacteriaceae bacterium]|nr:maltooligosyltrehalose trehalohydrolase [Microbacteriaceae bacterium]
SETASDDHARLLEIYRALAQLRKERPSLTDPRFDRVLVTIDEDEKWLILGRGELSILVNFSEESRLVPHLTGGVLLLVSTAGVDLSDSGVTMPGHSVAILSR